MDRTEQIWKRFVDSPAWREAEQAAEAQRQSERRAEAQVLEETDRELEAHRRAAAKRLEPLLAEEKRIKADHDAVLDKIRKARSEDISTSVVISQRRSSSESRLRASASPKIDAFIAELRAKVHTVREEHFEELEQRGLAGTLFTNNSESIVRRQRALLAAAAPGGPADRLKLRVLSDAQLEEEFARIRAELPAVERASWLARTAAAVERALSPSRPSTQTR